MNLTFVRDIVMYYAMTHLEDSVVRYGWAEKWKYKPFQTNRLGYRNFAFYIFDPVILQNDLFLQAERTKRFYSLRESWPKF